MSGVAYGAVDRFGVPGRVLSVSDDFYGSLGRVAALGALVELRMSDVVMVWSKSSADVGKPMGHQLRRFKSIRASRELPDGLVRAVDSAKAAMDERNELIHSLWPSEDKGWRNRAAGVVPTEIVGVSAIAGVIEHLVDAVDRLGNYMYSPID